MYEKEGIEMSNKIIVRFPILLNVQMVALYPEAEIFWDCLLVTRQTFSSVVHVLMSFKV